MFWFPSYSYGIDPSSYTLGDQFKAKEEYLKETRSDNYVFISEKTILTLTNIENEIYNLQFLVDDISYSVGVNNNFIGFNLVAYKEPVVKSECDCTNNQLLWGGCVCGFQEPYKPHGF